MTHVRIGGAVGLLTLSVGSLGVVLYQVVKQQGRLMLRLGG